MSHEGRIDHDGERDAPRYRFSTTPFPPPSEHCQMMIQVRRVDGDPDGGPFLMRTSSEGDPFDVVIAKLRDILARMRASDERGGAS